MPHKAELPSTDETYNNAWLVQLGPFGQIGRFTPHGGLDFRRGMSVICRTERGLEVGRLLGETRPLRAVQADGTLLRPMSDQDQLLWERIGRHRDRAFQACQELLQSRQIKATLMEVESLFDGNTLYFYFLGDTDPQVERLTAELAETYEAKVQFRRFAERLVEGCGPDCGTDQAAGGCSTGGCSSCGLAGGCSSKTVSSE